MIFNEKYGDTDSVESSIEINDLTESYFETYKERMNVLVKEEDDGEEAVSGCENNWIMKKGMMILVFRYHLMIGLHQT